MQKYLIKSILALKKTELVETENGGVGIMQKEEKDIVI